MQSFRTWYYWEIEGTVTLKIRSKKFQFSKAATCMGEACNFALNKVFAILLGNECDWICISFHDLCKAGSL